MPSQLLTSYGFGQLLLWPPFVTEATDAHSHTINGDYQCVLAARMDIQLVELIED